MEHIDLKAAHEEHIVDVGVGVGIWSLRKTQPKEKGHFCRRRSLEGEGGQMTRCHHREGERRPKLGVD